MLRNAKLKGIPLGSNNMVFLVSAHSTVGLEGKFQLWKRVKTGFYKSGKNNLLNVRSHFLKYSGVQFKATIRSKEQPLVSSASLHETPSTET